MESPNQVKLNSYEMRDSTEVEHTLSLLEILAISEREIEADAVEPVNQVFERLRQNSSEQ